MSLVGPRPPIPSEVEEYKSWQRRRLSMKPGLTCIWQCAPKRNDIAFSDWMKMDLQYIDGWSLWLDFKIILRTVKVVLLGEGRWSGVRGQGVKTDVRGQMSEVRGQGAEGGSRKA